jgi:hypothetical protein
MKLMKVRTARFAALVERCGQPETYTLWRTPEDDLRLKKLIASHHIMTVRQANGGAAFGEIGFHPEKGATYLVFPKSLRRFEGQRIVGMKWELVK